MPKLSDRPSAPAEANGSRVNGSQRGQSARDNIRCEGVVLSIAELRSDPNNANLHPERNMRAIMDSLSEFGQMSPITVRQQDMTVAKGNGTLEALKRLGWTRVACSVIPMTDAEFTAYALADNQTAKLSKLDMEMIAKLDALMGRNNGTLIGWSSAEIAAIRMRSANGSGEGIAPPSVFSDEQIVEAAFRHFRATGFPYPVVPVHSAMQEINDLVRADPQTLAQTNIGIAVADSYHPQRWGATPEDKYSPLETYSNDDKFKIAIRKTLEIGGKIGRRFVDGLRYSQNTQACANFRPGFALFMYRRFAPEGGVLLDTSMGYGGRLIAFFASGLSKYIGIDPSKDSYGNNKRMAEELGFGNRVEMHNLPAEVVKHSAVAGRCDIAFTSPPYFRKEHYADEPTQSFKKFPTGDAWRDGFLRPMLKLQYAALRPNRYSIINIADVKIKGKRYPLVKWTIEAALAAGFTHGATEEYPLGRVPGTKGAETSSEPVLIFKKD